jgi:heat shock protein HslJ
MSTDDDMDARLTTAGERWRSANAAVADVDLGCLEISAESVDVPVTSTGPAGGAPKRRRRVRVLLAAGTGVAAAAAATVIAVSLNDSPTTHHPGAGGLGANGLVGVDWRLVKVPGLPAIPASKDAQARLMIDSKGRLTGTDGCNSLGAQVTINAKTINLGPVVSTEMACIDNIPGRAAQIRRVDTVLAGTLEWSVNGDQLTLSRNGSAVLVYRAAPPPTTDPQVLTGTQWTLDSVAEAGPNGTASTVPAGAELKFDDKGRFTASDGCNSGGGEVAVKAGTLVISKYVSTKMACPASHSKLVEKILIGNVAWSIKDGQLTLTKAGVGSLSYKAAAR